MKLMKQLKTLKVNIRLCRTIHTTYKKPNLILSSLPTVQPQSNNTLINHNYVLLLIGATDQWEC